MNILLDLYINVQEGVSLMYSLYLELQLIQLSKISTKVLNKFCSAILLCNADLHITTGVHLMIKQSLTQNVGISRVCICLVLGSVLILVQMMLSWHL